MRRRQFFFFGFRTHPHGVLAFGPFISLCTDAAGFDQLFPGIECTIATLRGMFWFPIRREQVLLMSSTCCA